jgi:UDP-N-acetylglucosamine 2-epimerase (non-hydrolysing)
MHVLHVVGARPNFMKAAPMLRALSSHAGVRQTLVHTGQHYDAAMSDVFFTQLEMPQPDVNLGVGSDTHAQQTARVMMAIEPVLLERRPDLVLVYGDVNSTVAAALVCSKLGIRVGHVEAGLRSGDRTMPEEINRVLTDQISDLLFTPSADGDENLRREGVESSRIHRVGNVMIDTLVRLLPRAEKYFPADTLLPYALVTLHRPSNVDDLPWLQELLSALADLSTQLNVIFPVHPRTRERLSGLSSALLTGERLRLLKPLPYLEFLALQQRATARDHRLRRNSGRNDFSGSSVSDCA